MADTTYVDGATLLTADTMNDLNRLHYTILGDPADAAAVRTALGAIGSAGANLTGGINSARGNITQHATTMDFFAVTSPDILDGTGSAVTITACVNAPQAGATRKFYPIVATVLTHGATFDIAGNANLTAAAGDCWIIEAKTVSAYRVTAVKEDGTPIIAPGTSGNVLTSNGTTWTSTAPSSSGAPTGSVFDYIGATEPSGYVFLSGLTIGNGSSGGTGRANADTSALFTLLWDSMANTEAAVSSGRGASAAADFAANKTITLPDARGRTIAGKDNMGGTTASRLTSGESGIVGTTLGTSGGSQTHALTTAQLAVHSHANTATTNANTGTAITSGTGKGACGGNTGATVTMNNVNAGSGNTHQNTQPSLILNKIIKL